MRIQSGDLAEGSSTLSQRFHSSAGHADSKLQHGLGPLACNKDGQGILKQQQLQQLFPLQGWRWLHSTAALREGGSSSGSSSASTSSAVKAGPNNPSTRSSKRQTPAQRALFKRSQTALAQLNATMLDRNNSRKAKAGTAYRQTAGPWDGPGDAPVSAMPTFAKVESREWLLQTRKDAQRMLLAQVTGCVCVRKEGTAAWKGRRQPGSRGYLNCMPHIVNGPLQAACSLALYARSPGITWLAWPTGTGGPQAAACGGARAAGSDSCLGPP